MGDMTAEIKVTTRQLLQSTLFLGTYSERRYIESLKTYRDVIVVADSERDFQRRLTQVWTRLGQHFGEAANVGISAPPDHVLFVNLRSGIALGPHWFRVKDLVFFANGEIALKLKHIREVESADVTAATSSLTEESSVSDISWSEVGDKFRDMLTVGNAIQFLRFALLLLVTTITAAYTLLQACAHFSIRFVREATRLVHVSTPLILGISDILSKIFGGILILISMMWKDVFYLARRKLDPEGTPPIPPVSTPRPAIGYNQYSPPFSNSQFSHNPTFTPPAVSGGTWRRGQVIITEVQ